MNTRSQSFLNQLDEIVGHENLLTNQSKVAAYSKPYRGQSGDAHCVVKPGSLVELWRVLECCVAADAAILMQAANTSLTGGATPNRLVKRDTVLINTQRLTDIQKVPNSNQVVAFSGATLDALETVLARGDRTPHSIIGSSCLGASIVGGICNNSGGALVNRGPAYTELSLFAHVNSKGQLELVNHLDINLGKSPEEILTRLEAADYVDDDIVVSSRKASATDYESKVRAIHEDSPARYNGDPDKLFESSGCSGKLAVFAVRVDSFDKREGQTVVVGAQDPSLLTELRKRVLSLSSELPMSAEYMHQDVVALSSKYGRDTVRIIDLLGTSKLPYFFSLKRRFDALFKRWGLARWSITDRVLQALFSMTPDPMPKTMRAWIKEQEHLVVFTIYQDQLAEFHGLLTPLIELGLKVRKLNDPDGRRLSLIRYAAAGAAVRCAELDQTNIEDVLALDIALKRNDHEWVESLPTSISDQVEGAFYYGHFLCYVFHQDYLIKKGADVTAVKQLMIGNLDIRGAKYPAEHNVGTYYAASSELKSHFESLDPSNMFNPGVGQTSVDRHYGKQSIG